jgi:hypothetical protein
MAQRKKRVARPREVKIGYATYTIIPKNKEWGVKNKAAGQTVSYNSRIYYDRTQNEQELPNTIIHEILHAIGYVFGIKYKNDEQEEAIVNALANGLHTTFRDNPNLLDWLKLKIEKAQKDQ